MKTNLLVYQKADLWHPAFRPSGVMNSDVSEVTETDEDVLIINARDAPRLVPEDALERPAAAADGQFITEYVNSEKWCGEERTKYAVVKRDVPLSHSHRRRLFFSRLGFPFGCDYCCDGSMIWTVRKMRFLCPVTPR